MVRPSRWGRAGGRRTGAPAAHNRRDDRRNTAGPERFLTCPLQSRRSRSDARARRWSSAGRLLGAVSGPTGAGRGVAGLLRGKRLVGLLEQAADRLVPPTSTRLLDLKREYGVSMQALVERAYHLDLFSPTQRTSMYKMFSAKGWRSREPGSDDIAPEQPALAEAIAQELSTRGLSPPRSPASPGSPSPIATHCSGHEAFMRSDGRTVWPRRHRRPRQHLGPIPPITRHVQPVKTAAARVHPAAAA